MMTDQAKIVRVVDIETTGLPEDEFHAICEIGWIDLDLATLKIGDPKSYLVNPGHPIPARARAVHHISDLDVAAAMPPPQAVALLLKGLGADDILCAHHAAFEREFIDAGARRWICTLLCAYRAWPDYFSHSNQALRYEMGVDEEVDFDPAAAMPPHRALPDAYVTAFILRRLLKLRPVERLVELTGKPGFLPRVTFGEHYGKRWSEVPRDYLRWVAGKEGMDADKRYTAQYWLDHAAAEARP